VLPLRFRLGKALGVLGHAEFSEPISDLLHRGSALGIIGPHPPARLSLSAR
jgi:hypothetical protein